MRLWFAIFAWIGETLAPIFAALQRKGPQLGVCQSCEGRFEYRLVNSVAEESAYAYCESCGTVAVLRAGREGIPNRKWFATGRVLHIRGERWLDDCACGGRFRSDAAPRCPQCGKALSAHEARSWIEENLGARRTGWRWQGRWTREYYLIVEDRVVEDVWLNEQRPKDRLKVPEREPE